MTRSEAISRAPKFVTQKEAAEILGSPTAPFGQ